MENAWTWLEHWASYEPLAGVSEATGLGVDQLNYVVCLLLAYPFSALFRFIPTSAVNLRHFVAGLIGLLFGVFCFRLYILHVFVLSGVVFLLIKLDSKATSLHLTISTFAVAYLTICHLYRQYYYFGLYLLDITGPLMLLVQKLSSLGFSIHDAKHPSAKPSELQLKLAVKEAPTFLEYFGHVFFFPAFLAGPLHFFNDYKEFIEGKHQTTGSIFAAVSKFIYAFLCMAINRLPGALGVDNSMKLLIDDVFVSDHSYLYRVLHMYFASVCIRMQYYFAWILAEGSNNLAGFGWQAGKVGKDGKQGAGSWDLITNVNVFKVEFASNLKMVLDNWNIQTQTWLRYVCYDRTNSVNKTMLLSALWHGLYPGYFLTFLTAALQTEAARKARRVIRPLFHQAGSAGVVVYDFLTWMTTAFILNYIVGPFVVLEFWGSLQFWHNFLYLGHIVSALAVLVLRGKEEKKDASKKKVEKSE